MNKGGTTKYTFVPVYAGTEVFLFVFSPRIDNERILNMIELVNVEKTYYSKAGDIHALKTTNIKPTEELKERLSKMEAEYSDMLNAIFKVKFDIERLKSLYCH